MTQTGALFPPLCLDVHLERLGYEGEESLIVVVNFIAAIQQRTYATFDLAIELGGDLFLPFLTDVARLHDIILDRDVKTLVTGFA